MSHTKSEAQACIRVTVRSGVAIFEINGEANRHSVIDALQAVFAVAPKPAVHAAVACYDKASVSLQLWDLMAVYLACKEGGLPTHVPTAIVVRDDVIGPVDDYCARQATHGVLRAAFTDRTKAIEWATDMAALIEAQRAAAPGALAKCDSSHQCQVA